MTKVSYIGVIWVEEAGDSQQGFYRINAETAEEAVEVFNQEYGRGGCSHTHDCCGCWFYHPSEVIHHDDVYNYFIIKQSAYKNI